MRLHLHGCNAIRAAVRADSHGVISEKSSAHGGPASAALAFAAFARETLFDTSNRGFAERND